MLKAVERYLVTFRDDLADKVRVVNDLFADEKERCLCSVLSKQAEYGWCAVGMRAVVERQFNALGAGRVFDTELLTEPFRVRTQRR